MGITVTLFNKDGSSAYGPKHAGCFGDFNACRGGYTVSEANNFDKIKVEFDLHESRQSVPDLIPLYIGECKKLFPGLTTINFDEWQKTLLEKDEVTFSVDTNTNIIFAAICLLRHVYEPLNARGILAKIWEKYQDKLTPMECLAVLHSEYYTGEISYMTASQNFFERSPYKYSKWNPEIDIYGLFQKHSYYNELDKTQFVRSQRRIGMNILFQTNRSYFTYDNSRNLMHYPTNLNEFIDTKLLQKYKVRTQEAA